MSTDSEDANVNDEVCVDWNAIFLAYKLFDIRLSYQNVLVSIFRCPLPKNPNRPSGGKFEKRAFNPYTSVTTIISIIPAANDEFVFNHFA